MNKVDQFLYRLERSWYYHIIEAFVHGAFLLAASGGLFYGAHMLCELVGTPSGQVYIGGVLCKIVAWALLIFAAVLGVLGVCAWCWATAQLFRR